MRFQQLIIMIVILLMPSVITAKIVVNVGITSIQPPFAINDTEKVGLIYDVVNLINEHQEIYQLKTVLYPVKRLINEHWSNNVHIIAYNNIRWGWKQRGGIGGVSLTTGRDLFFSLKDHNASDEYKTTIGAVRGFHYAFAKFDPVKLSNMQNVTLMDDEDGVLRLIMNKRVHKGITSEAYLNWISVSHPDIYEKLLIDTDNPDHDYNRQFITSAKSPIAIDELDKIIRELVQKGYIQDVYKKYGMVFPRQ